MCIRWGAFSYAGQLSSASVDLGIAISTRKGGTPSRGTLQMSLRTGSSTPLERGLSRPTTRGAPLPKSRKGTEPNADSLFLTKGGKGEWGSGMEQFYYGNKLQFRSYMTNKGVVRHHAQVLGPLECAIADKLTRHTTENGKGNPPISAMGTAVSAPAQKELNHKFKLNGELLHGGKGKDHTLVHVSCDRHDKGHCG